MLPLTLDESASFDYSVGNWVYIPNARGLVESGAERIPAKIVTDSGVEDISFNMNGLTREEKQILLDGCLMNYYARSAKA